MDLKYKKATAFFASLDATGLLSDKQGLGTIA